MNRIFFSLLLFSVTSCGDSEYDESISNQKETNGCSIEDGTHPASVDYYNPETGRRATYSLDVEVADCHVTQINFPNGGWLDDSHISPTELDKDGQATLEDDQGRTFEIAIGN